MSLDGFGGLMVGASALKHVETQSNTFGSISMDIFAYLSNHITNVSSKNPLLFADVMYGQPN